MAQNASQLPLRQEWREYGRSEAGDQWAEEGSQKRAETKDLLLLQMKTDGDPRPQTRTLSGGLRLTDLIKTKDVDSSP